MYFTVRQMATKYPMDDTIHTSTELITLDTVRWQLYVLTDSALKLIDSGQSSTLPDISIFFNHSSVVRIYLPGFHETDYFTEMAVYLLG